MSFSYESTHYLHAGSLEKAVGRCERRHNDVTPLQSLKIGQISIEFLSKTLRCLLNLTKKCSKIIARRLRKAVKFEGIVSAVSKESRTVNR